MIKVIFIIKLPILSSGATTEVHFQPDYQYKFDQRIIKSKLKKNMTLEVSQLKATQKGRNLADIINRNMK